MKRAPYENCILYNIKASSDRICIKGTTRLIKIHKTKQLNSILLCIARSAYLSNSIFLYTRHPGLIYEIPPQSQARNKLIEHQKQRQCIPRTYCSYQFTPDTFKRNSNVASDTEQKQSLINITIGDGWVQRGAERGQSGVSMLAREIKRISAVQLLNYNIRVNQ